MRYRTFIALDVSPFCRDRLRGLQDQLAAVADGVRWVDPAQIHMTLVFLGDVDEREIAGVCQSTADVCAEIAPFNFTLTGLGAFPNPRRPRTLIAKVAEGVESLISLHTAVESSLLELGCYRKEERAFTPHVTLGRIKRESGPDLAAAIAKFAGWSGGQSQIRELRILASNLRSDGPEYSLLGRAKLRG